MATIFPTGTCFDDALEYLGVCLADERARLKLADGEPLPVASRLRFRLVHAICLMPEDQPNAGERFAHAWVEEDARVVYSFGILHGARVLWSCDRAEQYARLRVVDATYYSAEEAWSENRGSGNYGPWNPTYQALCRSVRTAHAK